MFSLTSEQIHREMMRVFPSVMCRKTTGMREPGFPWSTPVVKWSTLCQPGENAVGKSLNETLYSFPIVKPGWTNFPCTIPMPTKFELNSISIIALVNVISKSLCWYFSAIQSVVPDYLTQDLSYRAKSEFERSFFYWRINLNHFSGLKTTLAVGNKRCRVDFIVGRHVLWVRQLSGWG